MEFQPTASKFFIQKTPTGKIPTLEDDDVVMCESGAIIEYLLEKYGGGQLAPAIGSADRAAYLQWLHYAEATAFPPLGIVVWLTVYRQDAADHPDVVKDARARAGMALDVIEARLAVADFLVGAVFTAADIMMGFTLFAAMTLDLLGERPNLVAYLGRLQRREAFGKTLEILPLG